MIKDLIKLKVGLEILLKIDSKTENIRKVGIIQGWTDKEMIFIDIPEEKNVKCFSTYTPLMVGFVNEGFTYGFKSKLIIRLKLLDRNIFVIEYPKESKKVRLRKSERYKINVNGNLRLIKEGTEFEDYPIMDFQIIDINPDGCGIISTQNLKKGDKVSMNFILPPSNTVSNLLGLIVNARTEKDNSYEYGVKFIAVGEHKEIIERYISIINQIKQMAGISELF